MAVFFRDDHAGIISCMMPYENENGTAREVYKSNQHMSQSECNTYGATLYLKQNEPQNVKIIPRRDIEKTIYGQGIGSGAGYIESSNGTLKQL